MGAWDSLSIREKADMMKAAIRNGITTLPEIKQAYNEFAEGGDTVEEWVDAIYQNNPQEEFLGEPSHHYDFTQSEEWADAHGYYPDARGHRDDRVKKPTHPSHPSRGTWEGDKFVLSELGMQNPNYTLFGLNDGGQDPQAVLTYQGGSVIPEITATPNGNYIYNPYDNIRLRYSEGGNIYGGGGQKKSGSSFYQTHRARWFNFLREKGVNPVKAERLASYFSAQDALESGHGTSDAARRKNNYGGMQRLDKKTNKMVNVSYGSINDYMNAKWKMMNSKYSRALNAKSVQEYANILNDPKYHGKAYMYGLYKGYRDGQPLDVARQTKYMNDYTRIMMDIAGEKGFKGADVPDDLSKVQPENPYTQFIPFEPFNPQVFNSPQAFVAPTREQFEVEQPIVEAAKDYAYSPEQLEKEERRQGLNNLSFILGMMNGGNGSSFADTIGMLTGNIAAKGGKIYIKPENRGKFTALKERTGHSATWFKEHGTPAQRKMATFALNAAKWKHGYGGNLYDGTTEDTQQMNIPYAGELPDVTVMPRRIANKSWDKVQERWVGDMPTYYAVNPETGKEEMLREIGNGKYSTYDDKHVFDVLGAEAAKKQREQWIKNGGNASDFDKVILGTLGLGLAPIALPEIAAGAATALANPYVDAGLTSYFGAHGLNHAINEGINGWEDAAMTALEITPLGRVVKPMWNAGKEGLQYAAKVADNTARYMSPSYDLYRTIGETPVSKGSLQESLTKDFGIFEGPKRVTFFDTPYRQRIDDSFNLVKESAEVPKQYGTRFVGKYGDLPEVLGEDGRWYGNIAYFKNKKFSDPIDNSIIVGKESKYQPEDYLFHYDMGNYPVYYDANGNPMLSRVPDMTGDLGPIWWNKNSKWGDRSIVTPRLIKAPDYGKYRQPLSGGNMGDSEAILTENYPLKDAEFLERDNLVGTMRKGIFAQQPTPKLSGAPTIEWAEATRTPQITAENTADDVLAAASDYPFKYEIGTNDKVDQYLTRRRYSDKIHGKPTKSFLDFDPVTGDFAQSNERFAPDVVKGLPTYTQEDLMHNTVGRNMDAFINEGVTAEEAQAYVDRAKKAMEDVHVGRYSNSDYEKAGYDKTGGFYDDKNNFISVNEGSSFPKGFVEKHEGRHLIDYQADDAVLMPETTGSDYDADKVASLMQRAKQKQNMVLGDAYDNDFLTIPESKFAEGLESYSHMSREAVTTNRDARDVLFAKHNFGKQDRFLQNKYIDKMSDDEIFDAVSKANGYGRRYIKRLKAEGKLTPKKAKQFREAMKYVGAVATPVGVGLTAAGIASKTSDKK